MRTLCAAVMAISLTACQTAHSTYDSIHAILAHPQNYHGCEVKVRGDPVVLGETMPGNGKRELFFAIKTDDGKQIPFSETIDLKLAEEMRKTFAGNSRYTFIGTYRHDAFDATRVEKNNRTVFILPSDV